MAKKKAEEKRKLVESIKSLTQLISGLRGRTVQETLEWHEARLEKLKVSLETWRD